MIYLCTCIVLKNSIFFLFFYIMELKVLALLRTALVLYVFSFSDIWGCLLLFLLKICYISVEF